MSELTYKELCDHEYVQAYIAELRDDYNAELKKHGELEAENAQLKAECEQWKVVDKKKLHNKITKLEKERDDLLSNLESCKGNELANEVVQLKAELAQCQADKDEMVRRNKLLRDRPDLPMERLAAYDEVMTKMAQATQREARQVGVITLLTTGEPGSFLATRFPATLREAKQALEEAGT